jgi:hypothetical protein
MRIKLITFLTGLLFALPTKPYDGWSATIQSTFVNKHKVRIINTRSWLGERSYELVFTCNSEKASCVAPLVDQVYDISESERAEYECDEYVLKKAHQSPIVVCLQNVQ